MRASAFRSRLSSAAALLGTALLLAPPPVSAGYDDWDDDDRPRDHYVVRSHGHHHPRHHEEHGDWCPPRHAPPQAYRHGYGRGWHEPRPVARARYYCEPCNHWYDDEENFHYHVHHHHHVARAVIPFILATAVFGWVFSGY